MIRVWVFFEGIADRFIDDAVRDREESRMIPRAFGLSISIITICRNGKIGSLFLYVLNLAFFIDNQVEMLSRWLNN